MAHIKQEPVVAINFDMTELRTLKEGLTIYESNVENVEDESEFFPILLDVIRQLKDKLTLGMEGLEDHV